ncbi:uncharacterized protein BHQ10_003412 [Talaromyces amestolkiae]|uniref:Uncharacterized protein n=1 Tax=Talaromyces amestolkiae TaxID=1196081 RepID=A0A364KV17_TALAM|nr:uncharacterized protein BHQ10_003412 [Talaromyces amestolkiae]RAO67400.1 hypothetical protein BHQ10_003412 [Talaromyces amestolkiae]
MAIPAFSGYFFTKTLHNDIGISTDPTKTDLSQPGKVVLITGAGRGIGRSTALRYAESGPACIIICARTGSELDTLEDDIKNINSSIRVRKFSIDICNKEQVNSVLKAASEEEGKLNVLVNNAGTSCAWTPLADSDDDAYWETFHVNVKGTYLMMKTFLPLLVETARKEGTSVDVVNLTTIGANITVPGSSAYGVSKLAISRLTEFVTMEYGQQGVNCFAVHPGGVPTTLAKGIALPEFLIDTPELAAGFIVWLTKGQRAWLSGRYLSATWDVDELESMRYDIVQNDKLKNRMVV